MPFDYLKTNTQSPPNTHRDEIKPPGPPSGTTGFVPDPGLPRIEDPHPPGGTTGFIPDPSGLQNSNAGSDPLAALRGWLSSQGGAFRPDRPEARRLLRGLVGSEDSRMPIDLVLRKQLISPFIDKIRASRKDGIGSVAFLLNLLGYGAGQPPRNARYDNYRR